jgi:NADH/NAD ratio-sensing transcriptional regulator Rex
VVVLPAKIVGGNPLSIQDERVILSQKISINVAEVRVDASYPAHLGPASRAYDVAHYRPCLKSEIKRF